METRKNMKENILIAYDILILLLLKNVYDIFVLVFIPIFLYSDHEYREKHLNEEEKSHKGKISYVTMKFMTMIITLSISVILNE